MSGNDPIPLQEKGIAHSVKQGCSGDEQTGAAWRLDVYDLQTPQRTPMIAPLGDGWDLEALARSQGARTGTPILTRVDGRSDARINMFFRDGVAGVGRLKSATKIRYAWSLKTFLNFLARHDREWPDATREDIEAFAEFRISADDITEEERGAFQGSVDAPARRIVTPNTFALDELAIRTFFTWAAGCGYLVAAPVGAARGQARVQPKAVRLARVKWMTEEALQEWKNLGIRGLFADGAVARARVNRNEDRDLAFVDAMYESGLRRAELATMLDVEIPLDQEKRYLCGIVAKACAKYGHGGRFYIARYAVEEIRAYMSPESGSRPAAVARAQRDGRYERVADRLLFRAYRPLTREITFSTIGGKTLQCSLDELRPEQRLLLYRETPSGLEPMLIWLTISGKPRSAASWWETFEAANGRVASTLELAGVTSPSRPERQTQLLKSGPTPATRSAQERWANTTFCHPHMLRHSFALRWYLRARAIQEARFEHMTTQERRDFVLQFGDVWFLLSTLMRHRSPETTQSIYLEPFIGLDVEWMLNGLDDEEGDAIIDLLNLHISHDPRVQQPMRAGVR